MTRVSYQVISLAVVIAAIGMGWPDYARTDPAPPRPPAVRRPGLPLAGVITNPDWEVKPTGEQVAQYYPPLAQLMGLAGRVMIRCTVETTGALAGCQTVSEIPIGLGFGAAGIGMASVFRMKPKMLDGTAVGGAEVTVPLSFALAPDSPLPEEVKLAGPPPSIKAVALSRQLANIWAGRESLMAGHDQIITRFKGDYSLGALPAERVAHDQAVTAFAQAWDDQWPIFIDELGKSIRQKMTDDMLAKTVTFMESPAGQAWLAAEKDMKTLGPQTGALMAHAARQDASKRFCALVICARTAAVVLPVQGAKP